MKTAASTLIASLCLFTVLAGEFDPRAAFGVMPGRDLDNAIKRAGQANKRVFLVFWNSNEKGNYPGLEMKYFAEREETKKLLKDNFILVLLDRKHQDVKKYIPDGNIEKAQWVLIGPDGKVIKQEAVYGNPDVGLKTVKELIALP